MEINLASYNVDLMKSVQQEALNAQRSTAKAQDPSSISLLSPEKQAAKEQKAAQEFEAMFIQMSLKQMRPKPEEGMFNSGLAEDVFYQFMDEAIAKEVSQSQNNFGLAATMTRQNFGK